jgi:hypothetical protein
MYLKVDLNGIRHRYPNEIQEVMAALRRGKSIHKNAAPKDLEWGFDWCVAIGPSTPPTRKGVVPTGIELRLRGSIGQWRGYSSRITPIPDEIRDAYENRRRRRRSRRAR